MNRTAGQIISFLLVLVVGITVFQATRHQNSPALGSFGPTGGGTYRLLSSIGTTDSSVSLSSFKEPVSNIKYTMSYLNTDIIYGTLDPQTSKPEFISATGVSQNADGSATLTGVTRGLSRTPAGSACIASTTLAQSHAAQSIFIISDSPCFFQEYAPLRTNATSTAIFTFSSTTPPRLDQPGAQASGTYISTTSEFATIAYMNTVALAGVNNATESVKGIIELATALETASSTSLGSTGASLVLQAKYATDTPSTVCVTFATPCPVVAKAGVGKILTEWIDSTVSRLYTFGSIFATNASSTNATTTTTWALGTTNMRVPAIAPTASSSIMALSGTSPFQLSFVQQGAALSVSGVNVNTVNTGTTTLATVVVPANALNTTSQIHIVSQWDDPSSTSCDTDIQFGNGTASTTVMSGLDNQGRAMASTDISATSTNASFATSLQTQINTSGSVASPTQTGHTSYPNHLLTGLTYLSFNAKGRSGGGVCTLVAESVQIIYQR